MEEDLCSAMDRFSIELSDFQKICYTHLKDLSSFTVHTKDFPLLVDLFRVSDLSAIINTCISILHHTGICILHLDFTFASVNIPIGVHLQSIPKLDFLGLGHTLSSPFNKITSITLLGMSPSEEDITNLFKGLNHENCNVEYLEIGTLSDKLFYTLACGLSENKSATVVDLKCPEICEKDLFYCVNFIYFDNKNIEHLIVNDHTIVFDRGEAEYNLESRGEEHNLFDRKDPFWSTFKHF
jgi:hypothetical protein